MRPVLLLLLLLLVTVTAHRLQHGGLHQVWQVHTSTVLCSEMGFARTGMWLGEKQRSLPGPGPAPTRPRPPPARSTASSPAWAGGRPPATPPVASSPATPLTSQVRPLKLSFFCQPFFGATCLPAEASMAVDEASPSGAGWGGGAGGAWLLYPRPSGRSAQHV